MSDLEMIRICAEAMGFSVVKGDGRYKNGFAIATEDGDPVTNYDPLAHDTQAMAMVKKFGLVLEPDGEWAATWINRSREIGKRSVTVRHSPTVNRAIVECVVKMHSAAPERSSKT